MIESRWYLPEWERKLLQLQRIGEAISARRAEERRALLESLPERYHHSHLATVTTALPIEEAQLCIDAPYEEVNISVD